MVALPTANCDSHKSEDETFVMGVTLWLAGQLTPDSVACTRVARNLGLPQVADPGLPPVAQGLQPWLA